MIKKKATSQDLPAPIVFLGLSLSAGEARGILDADYRGPIRKGNLAAIEAPASVVIIDGVLDDEERLPIPEAAEALRRGISVYGASSTGALMACALAEYGMEGSGRVFEFLCRWRGIREDLIAALYVENGSRPVTVPLINVVLAAQDIGFGSDEIDALIRTLVSIPMHDRSWKTIDVTTCADGLNLPKSIRTANAKRDDARALLCRLRTGVGPG